MQFLKQGAAANRDGGGGCRKDWTAAAGGADCSGGGRYGQGARAAPATVPVGTDYDIDNDGLIEISNLTQLDAPSAMIWTGDGVRQY